MRNIGFASDLRLTCIRSLGVCLFLFQVFTLLMRAEALAMPKDHIPSCGTYEITGLLTCKDPKCWQRDGRAKRYIFHQLKQQLMFVDVGI